MGGRHTYTLERNGWCIPGPSVPVHTDMYTREVQGTCLCTHMYCLYAHRHKPRHTQTLEYKWDTRDKTGQEAALLIAKRRGLPFLPTLHVPGSLSQQIHSAAYPKQQESRRILISTARDQSGPFKKAPICPAFHELSPGQ